MTEHIEYKRFRQDPDVETLVKYLRRNFPGGTYYSAYEAGFCGIWIHNRLESLGVRNLVVNPADIPTTGKEKSQKRDSVDSAKIAGCLRAGLLKGIYTHSLSSLHARSLVRQRQNQVSDLRRLKNRIKALLYYYGVSYPSEFLEEKSHWSKRFIEWLKKEVLVCGQIAEEPLKILLEDYQYKKSRLLEVTRLIRQLSVSDPYKSDMLLLRGIPSIGLITGITFLVNIEKIDRFANRDKFAAFLGIIPTENSSGEREVHGNMTQRQQKELRTLLIESAWIAVRLDPALNLKYNKLCKRMANNKAIIRIARQLSNRIYYVLKNKQEYVTCVVE